MSAKLIGLTTNLQFSIKT